MSKATRRERHILVDVLAITGAGLLVDAISHRNWISILAGVVMLTVALLIDRKNIASEEDGN